MKKTILFTIMMLIAVMATAKNIQTVVLTVNPQMTNAIQEKKVQDNLRKAQGIIKVTTNTAAQQITVQYDADIVSVDKFIEYLRMAGFNATVVKGGAAGGMVPFNGMQAIDVNQNKATGATKGGKVKGRKNVGIQDAARMPGTATQVPAGGVQMPGQNEMQGMPMPTAPNAPATGNGVYNEAVKKTTNKAVAPLSPDAKKK